MLISSQTNYCLADTMETLQNSLPKKNVARKSTSNRPLKSINYSPNECSDNFSSSVINAKLVGIASPTFKGDSPKKNIDTAVYHGAHDYIPYKCPSEKDLTSSKTLFRGAGDHDEISEEECDVLDGVFSISKSMLRYLKECQVSPPHFDDSDESIDENTVLNYPVKYEFSKYVDKITVPYYSDVVFPSSDSESETHESSPHETERGHLHARISDPETVVSENNHSVVIKTEKGADVEPCSQNSSILKASLTLSEEVVDPKETLTIINAKEITPAYYDSVEETNESHLKISCTISLPSDTWDDDVKDQETEENIDGNVAEDESVQDENSLEQSVPKLPTVKKEKVSKKRGKRNTNLKINDTKKNTNKDLLGQILTDSICNSKRTRSGSSNNRTAIVNQQKRGRPFKNRRSKANLNLVDDVSEHSDQSLDCYPARPESKAIVNSETNENEECQELPEGSCKKTDKKSEKKKSDINEGVLLYVEAAKKTDIMRDGRLLKDKKELLTDIESTVEKNEPVVVNKDLDIQQALTEQILLDQALRLAHQRTSPRRRALINESQAKELINTLKSQSKRRSRSTDTKGSSSSGSPEKTKANCDENLSDKDMSDSKESESSQTVNNSINHEEENAGNVPRIKTLRKRRKKMLVGKSKRLRRILKAASNIIPSKVDMDELSKTLETVIHTIDIPPRPETPQENENGVPVNKVVRTSKKKTKADCKKFTKRPVIKDTNEPPGNEPPLVPVIIIKNKKAILRRRSRRISSTNSPEKVNKVSLRSRKEVESKISTPAENEFKSKISTPAENEFKSKISTPAEIEVEIKISTPAENEVESKISIPTKNEVQSKISILTENEVTSNETPAQSTKEINQIVLDSSYASLIIDDKADELNCSRRKSDILSPIKKSTLPCLNSNKLEPIPKNSKSTDEDNLPEVLEDLPNIKSPEARQPVDGDVMEVVDMEMESPVKGGSVIQSEVIVIQDDEPNPVAKEPSMIPFLDECDPAFVNKLYDNALSVMSAINKSHTGNITTSGDMVVTPLAPPVSTISDQQESNSTKDSHKFGSGVIPDQRVDLLPFSLPQPHILPSTTASSLPSSLSQPHLLPTSSTTASLPSSLPHNDLLQTSTTAPLPPLSAQLEKVMSETSEQSQNIDVTAGGSVLLPTSSTLCSYTSQPVAYPQYVASSVPGTNPCAPTINYSYPTAVANMPGSKVMYQTPVGAFQSFPQGATPGTYSYVGAHVTTAVYSSTVLQQVSHQSTTPTSVNPHLTPGDPNMAKYFSQGQCGFQYQNTSSHNHYPANVPTQPQKNDTKSSPPGEKKMTDPAPIAPEQQKSKPKVVDVPLSILARDPRLRRKNIRVIVEDVELNATSSLPPPAHPVRPSEAADHPNTDVNSENDKDDSSEEVDNCSDTVNNDPVTDPVPNSAKKKVKNKEIDKELLYKTPLSDLHEESFEKSSYSRQAPRKPSRFEQSHKEVVMSNHHRPYREYSDAINHQVYNQMPRHFEEIDHSPAYLANVRRPNPPPRVEEHHRGNEFSQNPRRPEYYAKRSLENYENRVYPDEKRVREYPERYHPHTYQRHEEHYDEPNVNPAADYRHRRRNSSEYMRYDYAHKKVVGASSTSSRSWGNDTESRDLVEGVVGENWPFFRRRHSHKPRYHEDEEVGVELFERRWDASEEIWHRHYRDRSPPIELPQPIPVDRHHGPGRGPPDSPPLESPMSPDQEPVSYTEPLKYLPIPQ